MLMESKVSDLSTACLSQAFLEGSAARSSPLWQMGKTISPTTAAKWIWAQAPQPSAVPAPLPWEQHGQLKALLPMGQDSHMDGCPGLAEASVEMYKNEATYFVHSCTTCRPFPRPPAACHLHSSATRASRAAGSASATASQLRSGVLAWQHLISAWHSSSWLSPNCGSQSRAVTPPTGV